MSSKTLGIFILLIFIALSTAAVFQGLEIKSYDLHSTLKERFFPASESEVTPAETTESSSTEETTE